MKEPIAIPRRSLGGGGEEGMRIDSERKIDGRDRVALWSTVNQVRDALELCWIKSPYRVM